MSLNVTFLQESLAQVCPAGQEQHFATEFYQRLFATAPEVQPLFAHTNMHEQKKKFMIALALVVNSLTRPAVLVPTLRRLGHRHRQFGVTAEHYRLVGDALLATLAARSGPRWTSELQATWTAAYATVAQLMQDEEEEGVIGPVEEKNAGMEHASSSLAHPASVFGG